MNNESVEYKKAAEKVETKLMFYKNFAYYIIVNIFLCIINLLTAGRITWAIWPIFIWGMVVVAHAVRVFLFFQLHTIKENMIRRELEKEKNKSKTSK